MWWHDKTLGMKTQRTVPTEMGDETIFTEHCGTGERGEGTAMTASLHGRSTEDEREKDE
jgi:hypothetical protein